MNKTIKHRLQRLQQGLVDAEIDALLLLSDENRYYFSGFTGKDGGCDESAGALLITPDRLILATDGRYDTQAREEAAGWEVICYSKGLAAELPGLLAEPGRLRLGVEARRLSLTLSRKIQDQWETRGGAVVLQPVDDMVNAIRVRKDDDEVHCIREALTLAETVFEAFTVDVLQPGMTEAAAAWALEQQLREAGAEGLSFPIIAAFGDNSAKPHAICGDRPLKEGQPLLFDWGVVVRAYCSDISRSFVWGQADAEYKKVHETVYTAQQKATEAIRPGMAAAEVDRVAREIIDRAGYTGKFNHGLGHGVGLAIHEAPRVGSQSEDVLEEGMVFTVEPGIYLPGWGGVRLENMVVVRADGAEVLNQTRSDLLEIG